VLGAAAVVDGAGLALCVVALAEADVAGAFADLASAEALPGSATDPPTLAEAAPLGGLLVVVLCADATDTHTSDASTAAAFRTLITEPSREF
jgi:hypothetical protein